MRQGLARSVITGRHWYRLAFEGEMGSIRLRDGAAGLPVFAPWDREAQIPTPIRGIIWTSIVCCGPGGHLPNPEWERESGAIQSAALDGIDLMPYLGSGS